MNTSYKLRILTLLALVGLFFTSVSAEWKSGDSLPALDKFSLVGEVPALEGKVTYVDFWASWCAPCKKSFPEIEGLYQEYKDEGFQVLAISVDKSRKAMDRFLAKETANFAIVRDGDQKLVADSGLEKMPTSYLVDSKGTIRFVHGGWDGARTVKELKEQIELLLSEK